jgi:hypothetical protein
VIQLFGMLDPKQALEVGKEMAFKPTLATLKKGQEKAGMTVPVSDKYESIAD